MDGEEPVQRLGRVFRSSAGTPPWILLDGNGTEVVSATAYLRELALSDVADGSLRAYAYGLLRWFRVLWHLNVEWDAAARTDVEVLVGSLRNGVNYQRERRNVDASPAGVVNIKTGKRSLAKGYAPTGINHTLSVVSGFYSFHAEHSRGPLVSPVPVNRARAIAMRHRSPMEEQAEFRRGPLRQRVSKLQPRAIPDHLWDEFFAAMTCERDRAILLMFVTSGARASELLNVTMADIDWSGMRFYVVSKGSREREAIPTSRESLRALQRYLDTIDFCSPDEPIWRSRRGGDRPLTYSALRRVIQRANDKLGTNWTAHDLRHTAATRLSRDPTFKIEEVQAIMRHRSLKSTGIYQRARLDDLIDRLQEHYRRPKVTTIRPTAGYKQEDVEAVFGD